MLNKIKKTCQRCKKVFLPIGRNQRFCGSVQQKTGCSWIHRQKESHPGLSNWPKYVIKKFGSNKLWNQIRDLGRPKEEILKLHNYQCQNCHSKEKLEIHHRDGKGANVPRKEKNNNLDNLMVLCKNCHIKLHKNSELFNFKGRSSPKIKN